jgi:prefoldin subunit 5
MPSFSDEFIQELHNKFLAEKITAKRLEEWTEWQLETYLQSSIEALAQQERKLEKLVKEISFTKKTIKNLKERNEILEETLRNK